LFLVAFVSSFVSIAQVIGWEGSVFCISQERMAGKDICVIALLCVAVKP